MFIPAPQELAEEYGKHRATEFNVGVGQERRGTGVRYADVAGIDHVKADIDAMMSAVLGKGGYDDMGVRPPRARAASSPLATLSAHGVYSGAVCCFSRAVHTSQWMLWLAGTLRHRGARLLRRRPAAAAARCARMVLCN